MTQELLRTIIELEAHAALAGWDQPQRLYALVDTEKLAASEPHLAPQLAAGPVWTPVEQDPIGPGVTLEELLPTIEWPAGVDGAAVVIERLILPPAAEAELPEDGAAALKFAQAHPDREEVRMVAGRLRNGGSACALRLRSQDNPEAVMTGPELAPGLLALLAASLEPVIDSVED